MDDRVGYHYGSLSPPPPVFQSCCYHYVNNGIPHEGENKNDPKANNPWTLNYFPYEDRYLHWPILTLVPKVNTGKELLHLSWQLKIKPLPIRSWPGGSIIGWVRRGGNHRGRHRSDGQSPQRRRHDVGQHNGPRAALLPLGQVGWLENMCPLG